MKERPILFSAPMVRALLEGRKTQTRRLVKPQPRVEGANMVWPRGRLGDLIQQPHNVPPDHLCPYGVPGDRLWVKHSAALSPVYWKPIPGWDGLYSAGTNGAIYRVDRGDPSPLKPSPTGGKGYPSVSLSRDGEWTTYLVHRLVCAAFYGPEPFDGAQVRHLDGEMNNNRPENLDWGTQEQNWQDRKAHGRGMGESHHNSKLTAEQVEAIRTSPLSQRALASQYGVSQSTIGAARTGQTWGEHEPAPRNYPAFRLWRSSIHMPRWASRLTLTITDVRVERVREISGADAFAEGVQIPVSAPNVPLLRMSSRVPFELASAKHPSLWGIAECARFEFLHLFYDINRRAPVESNPWVWALTFEVCR